MHGATVFLYTSTFIVLDHFCHAAGPHAKAKLQNVTIVPDPPRRGLAVNITAEIILRKCYCMYIYNVSAYLCMHACMHVWNGTIYMYARHCIFPREMLCVHVLYMYVHGGDVHVGTFPFYLSEAIAKYTHNVPKHQILYM